MGHYGNLLILTSLDRGAGPCKASTLRSRASDRLQLLPLFRASQSVGLDPYIVSVDVDNPSILSDLGHPQICFIHKINHHDDFRFDGFAMATLAAVFRLKIRGSIIVVSYCDNLASEPGARGELYRNLLSIADHVVVPCKAMGNLALQWTNSCLEIHQIVDPWQVVLQPFTPFLIQSPLRLVWFGAVNNIPFLLNQLPDLMHSSSHAVGYHLDVLTDSTVFGLVQKHFNKYLSIACKPWTLRLIDWDSSNQPLQLETILGNANVAWLPSDPQNKLKCGVSHNRLVDSVRSGCIPIASKMPSYIELRKICLIGSQHGKLLDFAVDNYDRLSLKYLNLRDNILNQFSPEQNSINWTLCLNRILQT